MDTATLAAEPRPVTIALPTLFKEPNLGCYCPKCGVWYNCASNAHAGH
jgi:hypothetical protein